MSAFSIREFRAGGNPLMSALIRKVDILETFPDAITNACLDDSSPEGALARLGRAELEWIVDRVLDPVAMLKMEAELGQLREQIRKAIAGYIEGSEWWETEVRDA